MTYQVIKGRVLVERKACERLWATNKYLVLSHSQKVYLQIREYLKQEVVEVAVVERLIQEALSLEENRLAVVNAYQHIWGYFKKFATDEEKALFLKLLADYQKSVIIKETVLIYLSDLLVKYPNAYLEQASIFKGREMRHETLA